MKRPIQVLLADDHFIVRMGLRAVFELDNEIRVIAEAATAEETIAIHAKIKPEVTLLDLRMPGGGIVALKSILSHQPDAKVLILTTSDLEEDIHRALSAGAYGYVLKTTASEDLSQAIIAVHSGKRWLPEDLVRKLAGRNDTEELSPREAEVLQLVVKGLTNPEIAEVLQFSLGTAKAHLRSILAKLQVTDRTEAAAEAYRRGLVS
jgi:two-component system, NarL family, response regulator